MPTVAIRLAGRFPARPLQRSLGLLLRGLEHALRQFGIFQGQAELLGRQRLGAFAELLALRPARDSFQPTIGLLLLGRRYLDLGQEGFQRGVCAGKSGGIHDPKGPKQRLFWPVKDMEVQHLAMIILPPKDAERARV